MKKIIYSAYAILNKKEKRIYIYQILLNVFISIIDIACLALLLFIVNFYSSGIDIGLSFLHSKLFNSNSLFLIAAFLLLFSLKSIAGYFTVRSQYKFLYKTASRISEDNLFYYLEGSYNSFINIDSAVFTRKIIHQPIEFAHYVLSGIQQIITESVLVLLTAIAIFFLSAKLFLLLFLLLLPAIIAIAYLIKRKLKSLRANIKTEGEKALQYLNESLSGFVESNIYDRNYYFTRRYSFHQQSVNRYLADLQITQGVSGRLIETFAIFGLFVLIAANKYLGNGGTIKLATFGAFITAAYKIIPGIVKIFNSSGNVKAYSFTLNGFANMEHTKNVAPQKPQQKIESVAFKSVSFKYNRNNLVDNLNFEIRPTDFIGISGISGKGKTTIANLLLGFLEPTEGSILINDVAISPQEKRYFWNDISYVKQQAFLIHDSILNNIILGDSQCDNKKLTEALKISGLNSLLKQHPEGLQKIITENGKNISGGQRQRISIARALYRDASLLILDEPFNELEEDSEYAVLDYLQCLSKSGKMIVLITHNKKNFSFCNKMIYLNEQ